MTATLTPLPVFQWINAQGQPLAGGQLFSYVGGTSTPQPTYTDATGSVANTNPVILDASGSAPVWLGSAVYKLVLTDSLGGVLWTSDNINAVQNNNFLSLTGGTLNSNGNTTLGINAPTGSLPSLLFQVNGVNSYQIHSPAQGVLSIGPFNGAGGFIGDSVTFANNGIVTFANGLNVGSNSASFPSIDLNGPSGTVRFYSVETAGILRWLWGANLTTESGSNTGSDFFIQASNDAGTNAFNALVITRSNQNAQTFGVWQGPNFIATSDERLKKNTRSLKESDCIKWVEALDGISFQWKSNGRKEIGFSAQQVRDIVPSLVHENRDGHLGVDYDKITAIHNTVIKSLLRRIEDLEHAAF